MLRADDFERRRRHLRDLSDEELHERFWHLAEQIVAPLVTEARQHTTPSIERSVLMRMGLSSIEARGVVDRLVATGRLGRGAGRIVLELAQERGVTLREAATALAEGRHDEESIQ
jgi:D-ornithine 4,5-aminomutase subunit alpha